MIYTKGPKTPSYHKDIDKFAIPLGIAGIRCLTSLYPFPSSLLMTARNAPASHAFPQLPCQKARRYSITLVALSIAPHRFFCPAQRLTPTPPSGFFPPDARAPLVIPFAVLLFSHGLSLAAVPVSSSLSTVSFGALG